MTTASSISYFKSMLLRTRHNASLVVAHSEPIHYDEEEEEEEKELLALTLIAEGASNDEGR